tara:strand:- start:244 stop:765 length:522 start_codon:yes stop_codon:yes gene_type:complete
MIGNLKTLKHITISLSPFLVSIPFTALDVNKFEESEDKALWQPPGYVFGIVWPLLYSSLFYMTYSIFNNPKLSVGFKNMIARDTLIDSGLQGLWLYVFRYIDNIKGRSKNQYLKGLLILYSLIGFGLYRIFNFIFNSELVSTKGYLWMYLPYFMWINFASILGLQLYLGLTKK